VIVEVKRLRILGFGKNQLGMEASTRGVLAFEMSRILYDNGVVNSNDVVPVALIDGDNEVDASRPSTKKVQSPVLVGKIVEGASPLDVASSNV